jgi:hypothetical protein
MRAGRRSAFAFALLGLCAGLLFITWRRSPPSPTSHPRPPARTATTARPIARLTARELRIVRPDSSAAMVWSASGETGPGMRLTGAANGGSVQMGIHGDGGPFVLVADGAARSFALGRADGPAASPILVYRSDDVVRLVFGLGLVEEGQPPFLAHYSADGTKHEYIGRYCDAPSRECTP